MIRQLLYLFISALVMNAVLSGQSIINSKHDLSASSTGATYQADTEQGVCIFCHTAHSTQTIDQLWNQQMSSVTDYTLYSSTRLSGYATPSQPNDKSKLCMSCHDGTVAIGSVYNAPGSGTGSAITMAGGVTTMPLVAAGYIGTDLTDDHPIGFTYDQGSGPGQDPDLVARTFPWDPSLTGGVLLDPNDISGTVECHTCHDPHNTTYAPFLHQPSADLCNTCHAKSGWDVDVAHYTTGCAGCHKPHGGGNSLLSGVEEATCSVSGCHAPTAATGTSSGRSLDIETPLNSLNAHPTNTISGIHVSGETFMTAPADTFFRDPDKRHAECFDCHEPHLAGGTTGSSLATALKGTWGVQPTWWTPPTSFSDNSNDFGSPTITYTVVDPVTAEWQICLKCHSDYTTQGAGKRNIALEINPNHASTHGIVQRNETVWVNSSNANPPFDSATRLVLCSDCHGSDLGWTSTGTGIPDRTDATGPHGSSVIVDSPDPASNQSAMLVATIASDATNGTPLCNVCHSYANYWNGGLVSSQFGQHPSVKSAHRLTMGCFSCHMYESSEIGATSGGNSKVIYVHGQNKAYVTNEQLSSAGTAQPLRAFVNGYIADIDFTVPKCWSESGAANCAKTHKGTNY
ncbi:MAG: cytochrome c3 family protein [Candidatus Marinimicrobia bacterium]|nr:cytochrome c3 family protein [Candidatus Neomarinimicrobiota bacterium]